MNVWKVRLLTIKNGNIIKFVCIFATVLLRMMPREFVRNYANVFGLFFYFNKLWHNEIKMEC